MALSRDICQNTPIYKTSYFNTIILTTKCLVSLFLSMVPLLLLTLLRYQDWNKIFTIMNTFKLFVALCPFKLNYFSIFYIFEHSMDKHKYCCGVFYDICNTFSCYQRIKAEWQKYVLSHDVCLAPSLYLIQWCRFANWTQGNKFQWIKITKRSNCHTSECTENIVSRISCWRFYLDLSA